MQRRTKLLALLAMTMLLAACGGGGGGGGGGGDSTLPDAAEASSEDAEGTTYQLQEGRYRLTWRAPDCEDVVIRVEEVTGAFTYDQEQRLTNTFINDIAEGEYTIAVTSDCDEWTINLDKF